MHSNPKAEPNQGHDAEVVREFFDGWSLYRKIVDLNYLFHREAKEAFTRWLDRRNKPFSFLDLGCGDAAFASELLRGRPLIYYTGMDLSPIALELAQKNILGLTAPSKLVLGDFSEISPLFMISMTLSM